MKYLLLDNEVVAKQKSKDALDNKYPYWRTYQMALHQSKPAKYPHPDDCAQYAHGWRKDELGRCEIDIPDGDEVYYPEDNPSNISNTRAIEVTT